MRAIEVLRPVAQSRDVAFLLNDRADLVRESGADGVHVGQDDMPARDARALIGPEATLGVTCKGSRDLAMQAGEDGADYVAFGAFSFRHQGGHALDRSGYPPMVV
jgi:thiamine-phosphate pyrophosphorylase